METLVERLERDGLMEALGALYTLTGEDWDLRVSHCLTEPTCPTAWVCPESAPNFALFRSDADTLDGAIDAALRAAHEFVTTQNVTSASLVCDPDRDLVFLHDMIARQKRRCAPTASPSDPIDLAREAIKSPNHTTSKGER